MRLYSSMLINILIRCNIFEGKAKPFQVIFSIKIYTIFREEVNEKSDKAYRYDREVFFL